MHLIYNSYATPLSAFLEGLVRVFDWGALLIALRRKQRRIFFENDDPQRNQRVIDRYIVESIAAFESEETEKLSEVPFISRRAFAVADIVLGPLPTDEVIISYEEVVPGAIDRIMGHASQRLQDDSEAEIRHFDNICRQGYRGMVSGFVLTLLLTGSALLLVFLSQLWAGITLVGFNVMLGISATIYVSRAGLRTRWFTGDFFPGVFFARKRYRLGETDRRRRPTI